MPGRVRRVRSTKDAGRGRPNTVGLGERELGWLLDSLEGRSAGGAARREFVRWPFRRESIPLELMQQGSAASTLKVACRNLSSKGVGLLHSAYVHPGTRCRVGLPVPGEGGETRMVAGSVVRCQHESGIVHEVGVLFDEPVNCKEFLEQDLFTDWFSMEKVDPAELQGAVVHCMGSELDFKIVRHYLRETRIRLRPAASVEEALELIAEGADLVIAYHDASGTSGLDLIRELGVRAVQVPSLLVTCDTGPEAQEALAGVGASAYLSKPLSQPLLLRALAEFLMVREGDDRRSSTFADDDPAQVLVEGFLKELRSHAAALDEHIESGDVDACRTICLQIKGVAPSLGFDTIARAAERTAHAIERGRSVEEASQELRTFAAVCRNARAPG